jgi:putative transposase
LPIHGERHYLWRAVDQDDNVLDILVQSRRNKQAAKKFFRKLLKGLQYMPRVIITDKLKSYGAAKREILPGVEHRQSRYLNIRCENSHRPTRQREYRMQGFKSAGHAQGFASLTVPAVYQHQYLGAAIENLWNAYQAHTNSFSVWTWLLTGQASISCSKEISSRQRSRSCFMPPAQASWRRARARSRLNNQEDLGPPLATGRF